MISKQLISITDLRQHASKIINELKNSERVVVVHNKPKAVLIDIHVYEGLEPFLRNKEAVESMLFLAHNPSFSFLHEEPDLYEDR